MIQNWLIRGDCHGNFTWIDKQLANYKPEETMLVGDQLMTDVLAGRGAHIRVMLTEKVVKEDQFTTHFNRLLDRPIRKHLKKKGKLPDWRTKYGQAE